MRDVKTLVTSQIRLYPPDVIPLSKLMLDSQRQAIQSKFLFKGFEPITQGELFRGVKFTIGAYNDAVIQHVSIEERRISLSVEGPSRLGSEIYAGLRQILEEINGGRALVDIVCTHETATSVVLDVPFEHLLSKPLRSLLEGSAKKYTGNRWAENYIIPKNLKFSVRYKVTDDHLTKNHITLAPKDLVIEPRAQSAVEDQLFFIATPTDSDTHFKLIEDLERALATER